MLLELQGLIPQAGLCRAGMMLNTGLNAPCLRGAHGQGDGAALPQSPSEAAGAGRGPRGLTPAQHPVPRATASSNCPYEHIDKIW